MSSTRFTAGGFWVSLPTSAPPAPTEPAPAVAGSAPSTGLYRTLPANQDPLMWIITRGEDDDVRTLGVYAGTEDQVRALVGELEESRKYVDPYDDDQVLVLRGDAYGYESTSLITAAAELIGNPDAWWAR